MAITSDSGVIPTAHRGKRLLLAMSLVNAAFILQEAAFWETGSMLSTCSDPMGENGLSRLALVFDLACN